MAVPTKLQVEFLTLLALGAPFEAAVTQMGPEGLKVTWDCILNGWVSGGRLTDSGRALVPKGVSKGAFVIRDLQNGKVVS